MATDSNLGHRFLFYVSLAGLVALVAAVSAISVRDPDFWLVRVGMILMTVGAALWLPLPAVLVTILLVWLGPNYARGYLESDGLPPTEALMELAGIAGIAFVAVLTRRQLLLMEDESEALNGHIGLQSELDEETGVYHERLLEESMKRELVRSRRFGREFALMLADIDPLRVKFEYRDDDKWYAGVKATAEVLLDTRANIDRVFRYGERGFALLLPETGSKDISGLVRRLARTAKMASPPEGEPGGPLPLHFGVTFFPQCATTVADMLRRAEVALRLAEKNPNRVQLDGAEAPDMLAPELLRREDEDEAQVAALARRWLGAEAPEEERHAGWLIPTPAVSVEYADASLNGASLKPAANLEPQIEVAGIGKLGWEGGSAEVEVPSPPDETPRPAAVDIAGAQKDEATGKVHMSPIIEAHFEEAVSDLALRLDETLEMIRSLKANRAA